MKKFLSLLLAFVMVISIFSVVPVGAIETELSSTAYSVPSESQFVDKLSQLRTKYPHNSTYSGTYYENSKAYAWTCHGYAWQIAYDVFGSSQYTANGGWSKSTSMGTIYAGDVVRIYTYGEPNNHTIFITKVVGDTYYYTDGNSDGKNIIHWDKSISKSTLSSKFCYKWHISGNTLTGNGTHTPSNVWIQASDDLISPGESIEFTFGATNATKFTIGIDKDGTRIITETISSGKTYTFEEEGTYSAYVTASGSGGNVDSSKIHFSVYQLVDLGYSFYAEITRTWDGMAVTDDNRNLALYTNTHSENQLWRFTRQNDGSYMIYNVASRGYMDLASSSVANKTNVQVIVKHDVNAQHWYVFETDVGYSLATKCGIDWRLDSADNGTAEGTNLQVYKFHNHAAQKFNIDKVDKITFNTNETEDVLVLPIHSVNGNREIGYNVIYTNEFGAETNTNIYGAEKSFDSNGKLVATRGYGVETKQAIPTYGFVFSMNSRSANLDQAMSDEYQYAYYDCENNNIELFKNESDYQQSKLKHLIGSKSFFKEDVYILQATNVDEPRGAGATVIYTSNYGANTGTNIYGNEVSFDSEGKLVGTRGWGDTTPLAIPSRGFAISEHSGRSGYQTILSENYQYGYCNFEQKVIILFKNKEDYELGKRMFCAQNQNYGELPVPVREGYTFDGWYTQPDGGDKIDSSTLFAGVKELYAHWTLNTTTILGDVDEDGKVSIMDATIVQRHIAQLTTIDEDRLASADTDKDGKVSIIDATIIQRFVAQLIPQL